MFVRKETLHLGNTSKLHTSLTVLLAHRFIIPTLLCHMQNMQGRIQGGEEPYSLPPRYLEEDIGFRVYVG